MPSMTYCLDHRHRIVWSCTCVNFLWVRSAHVLQVHTLAGAADRVRRDLVQVGAEDAVIKAKTKFAYDSLVKVR